MIIGIVGWIGSGKDTVAEILAETHNFRKDSFASTLKDAVAAVFGWDREMLEGRSVASRQWRESVDKWWADRLDIPNLTPRWVLQNWGTEVCREGFHDDIWIASLENKLRKTNDNIVISDCRFSNEISSIRNTGGKIFWVRRGALPEWYDDAVYSNQTGINKMQLKYPDVHESEWRWCGEIIDGIIDNSKTLLDLELEIRNIVEDLRIYS